MTKRPPKNKIIEIRVEEKVYNRVKKLAERHAKGSISKFVRGLLRVYLINYGKIQKENKKEVSEAERRSKRVMAARLFIVEAETKPTID